jgi:hypothetical protein
MIRSEKSETQVTSPLSPQSKAIALDRRPRRTIVFDRKFGLSKDPDEIEKEKNREEWTSQSTTSFKAGL